MANKNFLLLSAVLVVAFLSIHSVQSIDYESAKEGLACFEPPTVKSDLSWFMSIKNWYYVGMSRLDLYTFSLDVTGKEPKDLREDELYYNSCLTWTADIADRSYEVVGYHGQKRIYKIEPLDDYFGKISFQATDGGFPGTGYTVLTDNKTFSVTVSCGHEINQMMWAISSPYKSLPKKTMKLIHDHVKSLGFKEEYFTTQRYDYCKDDEDKEVDNEGRKTEL